MAERYKDRNYNALSFLLGSDFSESIKRNDEEKKYKDVLDQSNFTPEEKQQLLLAYANEGPTAAAKMGEYLQGKKTEKLGLDTLGELSKKLGESQAAQSDIGGIKGKLEQEATRDPEALQRFQQSQALQEHLAQLQQKNKPTSQIFQEDVYSRGLGDVQQVKDYMKNAQSMEAQRQQQQMDELKRKGIDQFADKYTEENPMRTDLMRLQAKTGQLDQAFAEAQKMSKDEYGRSIVEKQMSGKLTPEEAFEQKKEFEAYKASLKPQKKQTTVSTEFNQESKLRSEYNNLSKAYSTIRDSYSRLNQAKENPTAAGDMSLIFNYMRMLDPNSVVRESEYASAEKARGVPESIRNIYNKTVDGLILSPKQREDFVNSAKQLYKSSESIQNNMKSNMNKMQ